MMKESLEILKLLQSTPVPIILVTAGVIFLFLAVGGRFGGSVTAEPGNIKQRTAGGMGLFFLFCGVALYIIPSILPLVLDSNSSFENEVSKERATSTATPTPTTTPTLTPTKTEGTWKGVVLGSEAYVMRESNISSPVVVVLKRGDIVEIDATNQKKTWVKILAKNSSIRGWARVSDLKINFDLGELPISE